MLHHPLIFEVMYFEGWVHTLFNIYNGKYQNMMQYFTTNTATFGLVSIWKSLLMVLLNLEGFDCFDCLFSLFVVGVKSTR